MIDQDYADYHDDDHHDDHHGWLTRNYETDPGI
jgi:hypothetical protein